MLAIGFFISRSASRLDEDLRGAIRPIEAPYRGSIMLHRLKVEPLARDMFL